MSFFAFMDEEIDRDAPVQSGFSRGSIEFLQPANHRVLAYLRELGKERVLVVNNLSRTAQPVELDLRRHKGFLPIEMFGKTLFPQG